MREPAEFYANLNSINEDARFAIGAFIAFVIVATTLRIATAVMT